jgi:endoglucanase
LSCKLEKKKILFFYMEVELPMGWLQVDYILGANPAGMSYMAGFGTKYPTQVHQRSASIISIHETARHIGCGEGFMNWFPSASPNPNVLVGAIVGGPDINDDYRDSRQDSSCTEPTTYINSGLLASWPGS